MIRYTLKGIAFTLVLAAPALATAAPVAYTAKLTPLNGSGVSGRAALTLDRNYLTVKIHATGLEADSLHPQHIHGRFSGGTSGTPIDSVSPTLANDTDGDGFIEVAEGGAAYGPIILPLSSPPATSGATQVFPTAPGGVINFRETYDLTKNELFFDPVNKLDFKGSDVLPLDLREIVLHGLTLGDGDGANGGEANGLAGYKAVLPVASGEIRVVPLPAGIVLLGTALFGLFGFSWRQRTSAAC